MVRAECRRATLERGLYELTPEGTVALVRWAPDLISQSAPVVCPTMDPLDYWRLCDELSVVQAALLIVGEDPCGKQEYIDGWRSESMPAGYAAAKAALVNAITRKRLPASIIEAEDNFGNPSGPDWHQTTVAVEDLRTWLRSRGIKTGFFFPVADADPDYLSQLHSSYSPKLAAAIAAWRAVSAHADLRRGRSVKQALVVWLRQHANEFGLTKEDGNPNEQGIEDVAKIANWDTRGGAPKTPGNE
jgi:hypothetical protein